MRDLTPICLAPGGKIWENPHPMSYQVFARKYRPLTFDDVLGQEHVVRTLRNAIEQNRLAHAYLFVGPRGTGKTSTARIFAKALNCPDGPKADFDPHCDICEEIAEGRSLDVLEIDGASNRGIDHIRDLRDNVQFAPSRGQFRIVYIDEVHMLTKESFNALLKTLEEPPPHVKFIFATTEPHKILPTILSRCQRFDLRPIPAPVIAEHLMNIAAKEGVTLAEAAAFGIARVADGGMRDAQSMLDQLVSFCGSNIEEQHVNDIFGVTSRETVSRALAYMLQRELPSLLHLVHELSEAGRDMAQLLTELMSAVRELLVAKVAPEETQNSIPEHWRDPLQQLLAQTATDKILRLMEVLTSTEERMRWSSNKRLHLEMGLIQAVHSLSEANISDIIRALEGAPLPETPIATTALPTVSLPENRPDTAPTASPAPQPEIPASIPEPVHTPQTPAPAQPPVPEPSIEIPAAATSEPSLPEQHYPMPDSFDEPATAAAPEPTRSLEPIDDAPPFFGSEPDTLYVAEADISISPLTIDIWKKIFLDLHQAKPLQAGFISHAEFISEEENFFIVAVHPEDIEGRDTLLSEEVKTFIETRVQRFTGRNLNLRVETDSTLPAPMEEALEPLPPPPPPPAPTPQNKPKPNTAPPPSSAAEPPSDAPSTQLDPEIFYKDPLIQKALDEFHARIIS
ncbi:DNA polymerase III subunit gamma/tau [Akkermansia glycaniphila]|uniref:DNA polymerase III subunit gamma/tau n=1 Tax=Akkermansia glycaniphila TaxID=1679444 RepID=UPI001FED899A|nr:DNA polymerase III subunit gamma/tau [Akkermansia glycaniphila]